MTKYNVCRSVKRAACTIVTDISVISVVISGPNDIEDRVIDFVTAIDYLFVFEVTNFHSMNVWSSGVAYSNVISV